MHLSAQGLGHLHLMKGLVTSAVLTCLLLLGACRQPTSPDLPPPLNEAVSQSLAEMTAWFKLSFREKGLFHYLYDPRSDRYSKKNNELRQLMASRLLADLSQHDPSLLKLHRKNLDFVFTNWYREEGDIGFIYYDKKSKLGANAMALRTVVYSPDFSLHKSKAAKITQGILSLQQPSGAFLPWLKEPSYEYDSDYLLTFYSGEAILALAEYADKTGDPSILEAAKKSQDFYIDRYVTHLSENYYPAYVPWHTQSLSRLYDMTGDSRYANAIFVLNDELLKLQDNSQHKGRFYDPDSPQYGKPHSASDAVYTEGLVVAYGLARSLKDVPRTTRYRSAIEKAVANLTTLQYEKQESNSFPKPERAIGGIRISSSDPRVRIDSIQHAMDAYLKLSKVID